MLYKMQRYDARSFLLYIDSYENDVPMGRYYNPCREEGGSFKSLTQLLLKLEQDMDLENMPQSFQSVRTFVPRAGYWPDGTESARPQSGKKGSFVVHVLFRRNASWQGSLVWLDKEQTMQFRSVLELIMLLNSALAEQNGPVWPVFESGFEEAVE